MGNQANTVRTNCKICRREFDSFGLAKICPECEKVMEKKFTLIKEYISNTPNATISEICTALDVPSAVLKFYLKEERLQVRGGDSAENFFLTCEKCGVPISTGRYCKHCAIEVSHADQKIVAVTSVEDMEMTRQLSQFHNKALLETRGKRV